MKALLVIAAASLSACATAGSAKNPCGLVSTAQDPFLGEQRGFVLYLDRGQYTAFSVVKTGEKYQMKLMLAQNGDARDVAKVGQPVEFKLGDQVVTLTSVKESRPVANANQYVGVFTQWQLELGVSKEDAARFANEPLKAVKASFGSQNLQMPIEDANREKIQNSVACVVK